VHIQKIIKRDSPIVGVGFSMGGNMLGKYLGENAARQVLSAGIAVSQGYDGVRGIHHLRSSIYNKVITSTLKSILKR
jgi:predicted alpha/beta-fold hydrolase